MSERGTYGARGMVGWLVGWATTHAWLGTEKGHLLLMMTNWVVVVGWAGKLHYFTPLRMFAVYMDMIWYMQAGSKFTPYCMSLILDHHTGGT